MFNGTMSLSLCLNGRLRHWVEVTPFYLAKPAFTKKWIRDAGGFTGVNPLMPKLAQGVYGKTIQFRMAYDSLSI